MAHVGGFVGGVALFEAPSCAAASASTSTRGGIAGRIDAAKTRDQRALPRGPSAFSPRQSALPRGPRAFSRDQSALPRGRSARALAGRAPAPGGGNVRSRG